MLDLDAQADFLFWQTSTYIYFFNHGVYHGNNIYRHRVNKISIQCYLNDTQFEKAEQRVFSGYFSRLVRAFLNVDFILFDNFPKNSSMISNLKLVPHVNILQNFI